MSVDRPLGRLPGAWLVTGALLVAGLAGCRPEPIEFPAVRAEPPEHLLSAWYQSQSSGDALASGRAWLSVGDVPRALAALTGTPFTEAETSLLQRITSDVVEAGKWDLARQVLETRVDRNSTDDTARLELGLLLAVVDPRAVNEVVQSLSSGSPWAELARDVADAAAQSPEAVGWVLFREKRWALAEEAFQRALAVSPESPLVLGALALSREYQGTDGSRWMARAIDAAPDDARVRSMQSILLRINGDLAGSLDAQSRAAALAPENPAVLAQLAAAYQRAGELQEAAVWFERARALASDDPRFEAFLSTLTDTQDQVRDAILDSLVSPGTDDSP